MEWFSWSTLVPGVLGIAGLVVVARVMRKGLSTYTARRTAMDKRIRGTQSSIQDENQAEMPSAQAALLKAAVCEIVSLAGLESVWEVCREGDALVLRSSTECWHMRYVPKQVALRTQKRVLHGAGHWEVSQKNSDMPPQTLSNLDALMRHMDSLLRPHTEDRHNPVPGAIRCRWQGKPRPIA